MATSGNQRDVTLAVGIKTSGEEALRNLASEVQNLAKRGGDAAPAYTQLANELQRLALQAGQLETFKTLSADVEKLTVDQKAASEASSDLAVKLQLQRTATQALADAQNRAQAEFKATKDALAGKRYELQLASIETDRAGKSEADYIESQRKLNREILDLGVALRGRREAMQVATRAVDEAEAAERKLATQYDRSATAAGRVDAALAEQRDAMTRTVAAAEQLGISITDVAAAEQLLLDTQQRLVGGVADARVAAAREQAQADRQAITEAQALAELYERGRVALIAETAAINEAAQATKRYAAFQREVAVEVARAEAEQQRVTQALRETAAATTKANEEALKLSANADRIRFYAQAFDDLAAKERKAAEEAEHLRNASLRAAEAMREAFGQTGVRGLQAIDAEVTKVAGSLEFLERQFRAGAISAQDLARATSSAQVRLAQLNAEARNIPALPGQFESMSASINSLINRFGALGAAIATVGFAVKPVIDATIQLEKMDRVLTSVTGSSQKAGEQIEFARNTAQRAGQAFGTAGEAYGKFVAAALNSGVPMATVQKVFESTALAAGNLGLSSDETGRILGALGQIASKGVVQMEELRGQLGDALPGALSLMAKGLGLTEVELNKLVESGGLLARDALPALADALTQLGPKGATGVTGLIAEFNRLKNVVLEASTVVTGGAFGQAFGAALGAISFAVQRVVFGIAGIGESFTVVGRQIGATVAAIVTRDFKNLSDTLEQITRESDLKLAGLAERIEGTGKAASSASVGVQTLGGTFAQAARDIGGVDAAQTAVAASAGAAGAAATGAAASWVQLSVRLAENMDAAVKAATVAEKLSEAKRTEAAATAAVIAISGDEIAARQAALKAAQDQQAALESLAAADARVAAVVRAGIQALEDQARAEGRLDEATKKRLLTLRETLASKEADAEKTRQQAEAARVHALALDVQAKSMLDNAGKVAFYRSEVERTTSALASAIERMGRDKATKEDVKRATEDVARAEGLLRDAISDRAKQTEAAIEIAKLDHQIKRAGIQVQIEESRAAEVLAKARGDEVAAARESLKQKELAIALSRDAVAQTREEAEARKAAAEAELADTQNLTPEKRLELELRIKNADAKIAEAKAGEAATKVIVAERQALEQRNRAATSGFGPGGSSGTTGSSTSARTGGSNTAGFIDGSGLGSFGASVGKTSGMGSGPVDASYVFDLWARFQQGMVGPDELAAVQNALRVARANASFGAPGSVSPEGRLNDQVWIGRLQQIVDSLTSGGLYDGPSSNGTSTGTSAPASGSAASPASVRAAQSTSTSTAAPVKLQPMNVYLPGGRLLGSVDVASGSTTTLQNMLAELSQFSGRAA